MKFDINMKTNNEIHSGDIVYATDENGNEHYFMAYSNDCYDYNGILNLNNGVVYEYWKVDAVYKSINHFIEEELNLTIVKVIPNNKIRLSEVEYNNEQHHEEIQGHSFFGYLVKARNTRNNSINRYAYFITIDFYICILNLDTSESYIIDLEEDDTHIEQKTKVIELLNNMEYEVLDVIPSDNITIVVEK